MCSLLYDISAFQYVNAIHIPNGGQAMGNDDAGTPFHEVFKCLLHQPFRFSIQGGRRLIQQQNTRIAQNRPGYSDALAELLPGAKEWVFPGDFGESSGHAAGGAIAKAKVRPDAVFAANDMMALGCLFALNQAAIRVPEDIALVGFDDIPLARYVHPPLTTMRVNISELGARAARALLDAGSESADDSSPIIPKLIERASSGGDARSSERGDSS